ncbi:DUF411 domain-containing protein [Thalassolituus sp. LLYu03]|uniref:DUF411 domain-containing protein n=1 Tax=Thalassolituus sp. LLYu03 TaxID=3421656 RepID=UPI003D26E505
MTTTPRSARKPLLALTLSLLLTPLAASLTQATEMTVFKSPTCGCCTDWVKHLEKNGIHANEEVTDDMASLKQMLGIPANVRSCHTGVSENGFVFEGHVPARYVEQFLKELPAGAVGLTVPAMPMGSPGMEMGDHFMPYQVLLLKQDGSTALYADVKTPADQ